MAKNRAIGTGNALPWNIPEDFKYFKTKTLGHIVVMGRKTFDSIGKPLPGRPHIIITRNRDWTYPGVHVVQTVDGVTQKAKQLLDESIRIGKPLPEEVFICGGSEIYELFLPQTKKIYLTEIDAEFAGDAYFPKWPKSEFSEVARDHRAGSPAFDFVIYQRI